MSHLTYRKSLRPCRFKSADCDICRGPDGLITTWLNVILHPQEDPLLAIDDVMGSKYKGPPEAAIADCDYTAGSNGFDKPDCISFEFYT